MFNMPHLTTGSQLDWGVFDMTRFISFTIDKTAQTFYSILIHLICIW